MPHDGEGAWRGGGVGRFTGKGGAATWRGCLYYQTTSTKLARLNTVACVFEYETDDAGKTKSNLFEWK